jgi:hypothetical protein
MSYQDQNQKNTHDKSKDNQSGNTANPGSTDGEDMEFSEIGKPVTPKETPAPGPGIDTGRWSD